MLHSDLVPFRILIKLLTEEKTFEMLLMLLWFLFEVIKDADLRTFIPQMSFCANNDIEIKTISVLKIIL